MTEISAIFFFCFFFVLILYHIFVFVTRSPGLSKRASTNRWYWPVLQKYCSVHCSTLVPVPPRSIIIMQYNMYHKRPLDAQNAQPIPMPEGGRSERPKARSRPPQGMAWGSRGHFGGRCCLTAGATTDHSPDASRLRHPGTSNKVQ